MDEFLPTMSVRTDEGIPVLAEMKVRMTRIKRKHDAEKRVYYAYLGETFQFFSRIIALSPEVDKMSHEDLKEFIERFGGTLWTESVQHSDGKIAFD